GLHVAVALLVGGEDVVVGDDDHAVLVPDLGGLAEFFVEDADGAGAADVVGHEDIDVDPDVFPGGHAGLAAVLGENFLRHRHAGHAVAPVSAVREINERYEYSRTRATVLSRRRWWQLSRAVDERDNVDATDADLIDDAIVAK